MKSILSFYRKFIRLLRRVKVPRFTWIILILPISSFLLIFHLTETNDNFIKDPIIVFSIIGLLISNINLFYIFYKVRNLLRYKNEVIDSNNREKLANFKYELINEHYNNSFNFLHDLLNKCKDITILLEEEEYEKAHRELSTLYEYSFREFNLVYSNSVLLNQILADRKRILDTYTIKIQTVIEQNDFQFLSLNEQNKVFSVLLDFAIAETKLTISPRNIIIKTNRRNQQIIIQVLYSSLHENLNNGYIEKELSTLFLQHHVLYSEYYWEDKSINSIILVFPFLMNQGKIS